MSSRVAHSENHGDTYEKYAKRCVAAGIEPESFNTWLQFELDVVFVRRKPGPSAASRRLSATAISAVSSMQTVEEIPVIVNPDKFLSDRGRIRRSNVVRPSLSKRREGREQNGRYETARRRTRYGICEPCIHGGHAHCEFEDCPCGCNDSDFRFSRNKLTAIGAIPVDMAKLAQIWGQPIDSATVCPTVAKS